MYDWCVGLVSKYAYVRMYEEIEAQLRARLVSCRGPDGCREGVSLIQGFLERVTRVTKFLWSSNCAASMFSPGPPYAPHCHLLTPHPFALLRDWL